MNFYSLKFVDFNILDLGKEYLIHFGPFVDKVYSKRVKFIKTTSKGYNFLDIKSNKCIFKRHFYPNAGGQIVMVKSVRVTNFEIKTELGKEKFINLETIIK